MVCWQVGDLESARRYIDTARPMHTGGRRIARVVLLSAAAGVALRDSELIGLAPLRALLDTADHIGIDARMPVDDRVRAAAEWLCIRDASPTMALELRLAAQRSVSGETPGASRVG